MGDGGRGVSGQERRGRTEVLRSRPREDRCFHDWAGFMMSSPFDMSGSRDFVLLAVSHLRLLRGEMVGGWGRLPG